MSSNLTPSANLIFDLRFAILDWEKKKPRRKQSAENSENRCKDNVGKVVCIDVHARKTDQDRDG